VVARGAPRGDRDLARHVPARAGPLPAAAARREHGLRLRPRRRRPRDFDCRVLPFDRILPEVASGAARAGLLIHEGQLTYRDAGLAKCLDLGEWWLLETGLPLPLGVNVVRRDLGDDAIRELSDVLRESIEAALAHRGEALEFALGFGRGLDDERGDRFIDMYVNGLTQDYGDEGREAVRELLSRAEAVGAYDRPVRVQFAE
jgi:1,4-dihydroxy-6-naphthoate synthase